ncbi:MAG: peptidoglycan recognition family protein [archaeon]
MKLLKEIKFIVIHHSHRNIDSIERIKNIHVNINKWEDIGYHWIIDKEGNLIKGRNEKYIGAHVYGHNDNSLSVCLIGNLDEFYPTQKQIQTLIKFLKENSLKYKIPKENILGHNEFTNVTKTCPGKLLNIDEIKEIMNDTKS